MTRKPTPTLARETRREMIATQMAASIAQDTNISPEVIADFAVRTADALIARLEAPADGETVQ